MCIYRYIINIFIYIYKYIYIHIHVAMIVTVSSSNSRYIYNNSNNIIDNFANNPGSQNLKGIACSKKNAYV
jgi:hypothetical protein